MLDAGCSIRSPAHPVCPQITQIHPPTQKPQRRRDAKTQRVPRWILLSGEVSGRLTAGDRWVEKPRRMPALASVFRPSDLRSPRAQASPLLFFIQKNWRMRPLLNLKCKRGRTDVPQARRPVRRPATTDARIWSRRASHRRQAIQSPVVLPPKSGTTLQAQRLHLCVFAPLRGGRVGGLCVLCGSKGASTRSDASRDEGSIRAICVICVICGHVGRVGGSVSTLCPLCLCGSYRKGSEI
jgi:hypothetical protein